MRLKDKFFTDVVTLAQKTATPGTYGYSFGSASSVDAYGIIENTEVRTPDGNTAIASQTWYLNTTATVNMTDQITLPDGTTPRIRQLHRLRDHHNDIHHWKVWLE